MYKPRIAELQSYIKEERKSELLWLIDDRNIKRRKKTNRKSYRKQRGGQSLGDRISFTTPCLREPGGWFFIHKEGETTTKRTRAQQEREDHESSEEAPHNQRTLETSPVTVPTTFPFQFLTTFNTDHHRLWNWSRRNCRIQEHLLLPLLFLCHQYKQDLNQMVQKQLNLPLRACKQIIVKISKRY